MSDTHFRDFGTGGAPVRSDPRHPGPDHARGVRRPVSRLGRLPLWAEPTWDDGGLPTADGTDPGQGALSGGGRDPSGRGRAHGNPLRHARGRGDHGGPNFALEVPSPGYAWWYVDGISDGGDRAISIIGFIGSVFSPWYRWSGRRDPHNNVCINVATYGPGGRFTMTDRGRSALRQTENSFTVGPSSLHWNGDSLTIDINEIGAPPLVSRVRGQITLTPRAMTSVELALTEDESHLWRPFAPVSDIDVNLEASGWQWSGHGYFDANFGTRALEADFNHWTWGRFPTKTGATCFYDATRRDGSALEAAIRFDVHGNSRRITPPPTSKMRRSLWAVRRETRCDQGFLPYQVKPMLDAPFYNRAMVRTRLDGECTTGVYEALDLTRFRMPLLQPMIALRVPRRRRWTFSDTPT